MKVLQLCNKIPYPPKDGGAVAMLNLATGLTDAGHEVHVLAMDTGKHTFPVDQIPDQLSSRIRFRYVEVKTGISLSGLLRNLFFSRLPYNAERFIREEFSRALIEELKGQTFDIIQLEGLYLCPYIDLIRRHSGANIVYRAHNLESEVWKRMIAGTRNLLKRYYLKILTARLTRFEKDYINRYDLLLPISDRDARSLQALGNTRPALVLPTGITPENFREDHTVPNPRKFFFLGALDWMPNQEGLVWLLKEVWPRVREHLPTAEWHIAGRNAPRWLADSCKAPGVIFHGEVDDAAEFSLHYPIMLAPLFAGSGIRIKIIEAMARSRVVITTPVGAEGLGIKDGVHALIREPAEDFAKAMADVYTNDDIFIRLRKNAYAFAREQFDNSQLTGTLIRFYKQPSS